MRIGIPTEVKTLEARVAMVPAACAQLVGDGHEVFLQSGAGLGSGYGDELYTRAGVTLVPDAAALYERAELVIKVKEPQPQEWPLLRRDHRLFCYLHLAAEPELTRALLDIGLTAVAFETVQEGRSLPLLAPMSDIAGRLAAQIGTTLLHRPAGGKGILMGGLPGVERGHAVVVGAGVAGGGAAAMLAGIGAQVTVFDLERDKLAQMRALGPNVTGLHPFPDAVAQAVAQADLLIGAVLVTGARAPHVVSEEMVRSMGRGSVVMDISVDQGGCIETTRPTTYAEPTYELHGVTHFAVTNMPGGVPRTSSQALCAALIPYVRKMAQSDWRDHPALAVGVNVDAGSIVHPALKN